MQWKTPSLIVADWTHLDVFDCFLAGEPVPSNDGRWVDLLLDELIGVFEQLCGKENNWGSTVANLFILKLGELDQHLRHANILLTFTRELNNTGCSSCAQVFINRPTPPRLRAFPFFANNNYCTTVDFIGIDTRIQHHNQRLVLSGRGFKACLQNCEIGLPSDNMKMNKKRPEYNVSFKT